MLQSWYFKATLTTFSLVEIFGWTIGWTLYLAVSRRVALTYGRRAENAVHRELWILRTTDLVSVVCRLRRIACRRLQSENSSHLP